MRACEEIRRWLDAYADGELDPAHTLEVESHLEGCAACARECRQLRELAEVLASAPRYAAPADLRKLVGASLRAEALLASASQGSRASPRERFARMLEPFVGGALTGGSLAGFAALAVVFCVALAATWTSARRGVERDLLAREIIGAHVRSLMGNHLADVVSTDRHTVKPWFNGKLDFSPPVADFAARGFPLAGGRLDYFGERPMAALIYTRDRHVINLFVGPETGTVAALAVGRYSRQGYHACHWSRGDLGFWAVSDLNEGELGQFVELVKAPSAPAR